MFAEIASMILRGIREIDKASHKDKAEGESGTAEHHDAVSHETPPQGTAKS